jgi:EmrB/QacA subfamily drug resistance transporter
MTSGDLDARAKGLALALLAVTQFVIILDASIVNVALPSIGAALDFSQDNLSWVVNAYTLTFGGFLLLGGRLADLMGRRRMFMSGLVLFTAASLLGGLAQSDVWLIAARAAQGLGAALVSPAALSLVTTIFSEGAERNRALGVWGAVAGSGGAAGVLLGGMLTEWAGWEWVLFVNVPIGLAAVALAPRLLPESRDVGAARTFDATGAVLVTAGLALLVYTLVDAESAGWTSTQTLGLGALSLATLAAFVAWESRASEPLMPFSIFRLQTLRGANAVGLLLGMALFSMFYFLSLYMQQVLGYSALETGFAFLPLAVMIIVSSTVASQLVTRTGARPTLVVGMLLITGALVWFSQVSAGGSYVGDVLFPALVVAVGLGFAFVPVTIAAVTGTRPDEAGLASGLINTSQQIGGALGLAILVSVATSRTASAVAEGVGDQAVALNEGFQTAFLVGAGFTLVGAIVATLTISSRDCRQQIEGGVEVPVPCVGQPQVQLEVAPAPAGAQATAATTNKPGGVDRREP